MFRTRKKHFPRLFHKLRRLEAPGRRRPWATGQLVQRS